MPRQGSRRRQEAFCCQALGRNTLPRFPRNFSERFPVRVPTSSILLESSFGSHVFVTSKVINTFKTLTPPFLSSRLDSCCFHEQQSGYSSMTQRKESARKHISRPDNNVWSKFSDRERTTAPMIRRSSQGRADCRRLTGDKIR